MRNQFLSLLFIIIFPYFLIASDSNANPESVFLAEIPENEQIHLPTKFKKSDWFNLNDYFQGRLPIIYNQEEEPELNKIVQSWRENNLCFLQQHYNLKTQETLNYYYAKVIYSLQKSINIKKNAPCEKNYNKKDKKNLRDKIKGDENDIVLLDKEIKILESIKDADLIALKQIIDMRKTEIEFKQERIIKSKNELRNKKIIFNQYVKKSTYELVGTDQDRDMFDLKIQETKSQNSDKKIILNCKNNSVKFEQFQDHVNKTDTKSSFELNKIILIQSLIAAHVNIENINPEQFNLSTYHNYIFSLGIFFKWYTNITWCDFYTCQNEVKNINRINILLNNSIKKWTENQNEHEKKYKESFLSLIKNGLHRYEYAWMSQWQIDNNIIRDPSMTTACKRAKVLLENFKDTEYFKELYTDKIKLLNMYLDSWWGI